MSLYAAVMKAAKASRSAGRLGLEPGEAADDRKVIQVEPGDSVSLTEC